MSVSWWKRLGIAYVVVYFLPGPAFEAAERSLVVLAGRWLFGLTLTIFPRGSGDTTYSYVALVVKIALAVLAATIWHVVQRGHPVSPRTRDRVWIGLRYVLGGIMVGYGWAKFDPTQMPAPGPERLIGTIGDMSPMGLLWTFMGASLPYQMFAGFAEALGGLLLFWRRTTLLGALILTGVLINVVALNFCYDVPVKLFSTHLLAIAVVLVWPHLLRLADVILLNRATAPIDLRPFPVQRLWVRRTALAAKAVVVLVFAVPPIVMGYQRASLYGFLAPRNTLSGVYRVTTFSRTDGPAGPATLDDAKRWVRVAIGVAGDGIAIQRADGTRHLAALTIDTGRNVWTTQTAEDGVTRVDYRVDTAGVVTIEGTIGADLIRAVLTPQGESVLLGRGFHWVNEYPFNR